MDIEITNNQINREEAENIMDLVLDRFFEYGQLTDSLTYTPIGHFWIARHNGYDTLTFEPNRQNQYEIAVRIRTTTEAKMSKFEYQGYKVNNPFCEYFRGIRTGGH